LERGECLRHGTAENFETRDASQAWRSVPKVRLAFQNSLRRSSCRTRAKNSRNRHECLSQFAVFGFALCSQFDTGCRAAPILVERCTRTLEELAFADTTLDLYKVYHSSPNEQTPELRQKLNEGKTGAPWPASRSDRAITRAINSRQSCHDVRLTGCKNVEARHQMHAALWRTPSILREGARKARLYFARQIEISGTTNERTSFVL